MAGAQRGKTDPLTVVSNAERCKSSGMVSIRRHTTVSLLATLAVVLALPATALADHIIGTKAADGDFASASAEGYARKPQDLYVRLATSPSQPANAHWTVICVRHHVRRTRSGAFSGKGTFRHRVSMPFTRPDACTLSASAELERTGKLRVILLAG